MARLGVALFLGLEGALTGMGLRSEFVFEINESCEFCRLEEQNKPTSGRFPVLRGLCVLTKIPKWSKW